METQSGVTEIGLEILENNGRGMAAREILQRCWIVHLIGNHRTSNKNDAEGCCDSFEDKPEIFKTRAWCAVVVNPVMSEVLSMRISEVI